MLFDFVFFLGFFFGRRGWVTRRVSTSQPAHQPPRWAIYDQLRHSRCKARGRVINIFPADRFPHSLASPRLSRIKGAAAREFLFSEAAPRGIFSLANWAINFQLNLSRDQQKNENFPHFISNWSFNPALPEKNPSKEPISPIKMRSRRAENEDKKNLQRKFTSRALFFSISSFNNFSTSSQQRAGASDGGEEEKRRKMSRAEREREVQKL
jgi:hypothetical protein